MPKSPHPEVVTSDPDRGVAVNSGTDPQRPGGPARPPSDSTPPGTSAEETSVTTDRFDATRETDPGPARPDVEHGGGGSKDSL